ncbi:hypothetical protein [Streptomyces sp. NBC_00620]|uniref:hypothetical protein n=1 Tax=Streptomyces sp. NBC_00620 TaxID=2903666 RepID=UPI002253BD59|nr:hypothetical protein [Streptomyces sp. NBC_00620]MCX4973142.1 hypothetical protein [Streptomyces sp. NBC_00620]
MTNKKDAKQGKVVQLGTAYDHSPQVTTEVQATDDPDVFSFACTPPAGDWSASGTVRRAPNGLIIDSLEIRPGEPTLSGVTGNLLRRVPVGVILNHVRADAARLSQPEREAAPQAERAPRRGGRAALSDDLLRRVAVAYLGETRPDKPAGALQRLATEFGRPEGTVRTWLARARTDGWLGPSVKGRAGAEPGPLLRDLTAAEYTRIYSAQTTLEDQARIVAGATGVSLDEARQDVYGRAGVEPPEGDEG